MNPNSTHQRWSKWTLTIVPGGVRRPTFREIKSHAAVFARALFGSVTTMRVTMTGRAVQIDLVTEGAPVHDPTFVNYMRRMWDVWAVRGFGTGTTLDLDARLVAGSRQNGSPVDQMILGPPAELLPRL